MAGLFTYTILVKTGTKEGAGTDARVFLTMIGERGQTAEIQLAKSGTNSNPFEHGQSGRQNSGQLIILKKICRD